MRRRLVLFLALTLVATTAWPAGKVARPRVYDLIAGGEQDYTVAPGDNLWAITGRFTMNRGLLQSWNELPAPDALRPGMHLKVSDRPHRAAPRVRRHRDRHRGAHPVLVPEGREARDGTPVDIVYEPVKLARDASGRVWLEVHRHVLGAKQSELPAVLDFIQAAGLTEAVDATRVVEAVAHAWGTPEDVSLPPPAPAGAAAPAAAIVPAADARTLPAAAP